jgi:hypothetical protein
MTPVFARFLSRIGIAKRSPSREQGIGSLRAEIQARVDADNSFTNEEREEIFRRGAGYAGTDDEAARADAAFEAHLRGLESVEFRSRLGPSSTSGR